MIKDMADAQIHVTIKKPSKNLEAFVRELGLKKEEHRKEVQSRIQSAEKIEVK